MCTGRMRTAGMSGCQRLWRTVCGWSQAVFFGSTFTTTLGVRGGILDGHKTCLRNGRRHN